MSPISISISISRSISRSISLLLCVHLILLVFSLPTAVHAQSSQNNTKTAAVATKHGKVVGLKEADVNVFRGIPYAAPPVKSLRWKPPQDPKPWSTDRDCFEFGPACPQQPSYVFKNAKKAERQSEDCLYLNVWTPSLKTDAKLPVMFWIHGGGNNTGYGHQPTYMGQNLAAKNVVVVTINYRLGNFGFFAHPLLTAESKHKASGNYGNLDQIHALKWVRDNIANFGGDPANVTIFGESAGGVNCSVLALSPLAKGLFHRMISQSGVTLMGRKFLAKTVSQSMSAHEIGQKLAAKMTSKANPTLQELRAVSVEAILNIRSSGGKPGRSAPISSQKKDAIGVIIDGHVIPKDPYQLLEKGEFNKVPLLIGLNSDEATIFTRNLRLRRPIGFRLTLNMFLPDADPIEAMKIYPANTGPQATQAFRDLMSDSMFLRPGRQFADAFANAGQPVYFYYFKRQPPFFMKRGLGAYHSIEIGYVFETHKTQQPYAYEPIDVELGKTMSEYWRSFAQNGVPTCKDQPEWPKYEPKAAKYLIFDTKISISDHLREKQYQFLKKMIENRLKKEK